MGGAVRLMRKKSGSLSISDQSFDEDDEEEDSISGNKSPEPKRRKSTQWESSPKRNVIKKEIAVMSETVMVDTDPADADEDSTKTRNVISSKRSSSCSIRSTDSIEYTRCDSALSLSSSETRSSSSKVWSLEEFSLGKALGKVRTVPKKSNKEKIRYQAQREDSTHILFSLKKVSSISSVKFLISLLNF